MKTNRNFARFQDVAEAKNWIKQKRKKLRKIDKSDKTPQEKARRAVAIAATVARYESKYSKVAKARHLLCRKAGVKVCGLRKDASPHLPLIRLLRLDKSPASTRRLADGIAACLRRKGSWSETKALLMKKGVAYISYGREDV